MAERTTVRTVERSVRVGSKSLSTQNLSIKNRSSSTHRSSSPIEHVKQQLTAFVDHSHLEKSELSKLNDRMADYVDRVKHLENENKALMREIRERQANWGEDTRKVRDQFEQTLFDVRGQIDDVANLKTIADVRNKRAQYENLEFQRRADDTVRATGYDKNKIGNLERELEQLNENKILMNRSLQDAYADLDKFKGQRDDTWAGLVELLDRLDEELYRRIAVEYNNQTLREHIEFIKQINEKEILEMSQLANVLPFNDQVEFYKDQLKRVISNIRNDYEQLNLEQQREMEEWMRVKTEEVVAKAKARDPIHEMELNMQIETIEGLRESHDSNAKELDDLKSAYDSMTKRLQSLEEHVEVERVRLNQKLDLQNEEIKNLNDNLDHLVEDYNHITANKASLEYEMQVYKRLLDSQLGRFNANYNANSSSSSAQASAEKEKKQTEVSSNQFGGKVQNKKEKKGSIGIGDSSPDGKYIVIENTGANSAQIDLSGWSIKRRVDSNNELTYKIPGGVVLPANKELIIWGASYSTQRGSHDLVTEFDNWGIGINSVTRLLNPSGEEKSSFNQQISFSSQY